jgi:hypothetical protein
MLKRLTAGALACGLAIAFGALVGVPGVSAASAPSGQRMLNATTFDPVSGQFVGGGASIEPALNDVTGETIYLLTPNKEHVHPNSHNVAPLYLPVYPVVDGSPIDAASLNCMHIPADNCPNHGVGVAGAAQQIEPDVYNGGVLGHDHLAGVAKSGGDFNVLWEPTLVLFTNKDAGTHRLMTDDDVDAAVDSGNAKLVPLPQLIFPCPIVSAAVYNHATPAPTIPTP